MTKKVINRKCAKQILHSKNELHEITFSVDSKEYEFILKKYFESKRVFLNFFIKDLVMKALREMD